MNINIRGPCSSSTAVNEDIVQAKVSISQGIDSLKSKLLSVVLDTRMKLMENKSYSLLLKCQSPKIMSVEVLGFKINLFVFVSFRKLLEEAK